MLHVSARSLGFVSGRLYIIGGNLPEHPANIHDIGRIFERFDVITYLLNRWHENELTEMDHMGGSAI